MKRRSLQAVLWDRPYLRWDLVPLAVHLHSRGYIGDTARNRVVDAVASGESLTSLVRAGLLRPEDVAGCTKVYPSRNPRRLAV